MITVLKYKITTIYHDIYIKIFSDGTISYLKVSTDGSLNTNNNDIDFHELRKVFQESFEIRIQERTFLKYLGFGFIDLLLG